MYAAHKKKFLQRLASVHKRYGITFGQRGLITSLGRGQAQVMQ